MAWVLTQDKIGVVNVSGFSIDMTDFIKSNKEIEEEKRPKFYRIWGQSADHDYVLGAYKELDKALEVIGQFAEHIKSNENALSGTSIFEMPQDPAFTQVKTGA